MSRVSWTRRRILALSAAGLASLAGCSDLYGPGGIIEDRPSDDYDGQPHGDNTDPDGPSNQPPDTPAANIRTQGGGESYPLHDLPIYTSEFYTYEDAPWPYYNHPDSRVITADVDGSTVTVSVGAMQLNRDIRLYAYYTRADGTIGSTDTTTVSPEGDGYRAYEREFPINGDEFPRNTKTVVKIIAQDTHPGDTTEYILKEQRVVAIPYRNAAGSGVRYLCDEAINYNGSRGELETPDRLYTEVDDSGNDRTRFYALCHPVRSGRILGAYSNIPDSDYGDYMSNRNNASYRRDHHPGTYMYNADDFEYFTTLADSFTTALDNAGFTTRFARLQQLAYLVGSMEYVADPIKDLQVYTIYNSHGDCSEMTMLYLALMNTSAFGHARGAFIAGKIADVDHAVVGIDERDINPPDPDAIYWVEPSDEMKDRGIPDTRYAFTELTSPNKIGHFNSDIHSADDVLDTTNLDYNTQLRDF